MPTQVRGCQGRVGRSEGGITAEGLLPWAGLLQEEKGIAARSRPSYSRRLTMRSPTFPEPEKVKREREAKRKEAMLVWLFHRKETPDVS